MKGEDVLSKRPLNQRTASTSEQESVAEVAKADLKKNAKQPDND